MEDTAFIRIRSTADCLNENVNGLQLCEARTCLEEATKTIAVKVGQLGSISLSLCDDCVSKFREE